MYNYATAIIFQCLVKAEVIQNVSPCLINKLKVGHNALVFAIRFWLDV